MKYFEYNIDDDPYASHSQEIREQIDDEILKSLGVKIKKKCNYSFDRQVNHTGTIYRKICKNEIENDELYCHEHKSVDLA